MLYSTFIGGSNHDFCNDIAIDSSGNAYVAGRAQSGYNLSAGAYDTTQNGNYDVVLSKLALNGNSAADLFYSTYIGGTNYEVAFSIALDSNKNAYLTGFTGNGDPDYPATSGAYDDSYTGGTYDAFVSKFLFPDIPTYNDGDWVDLGIQQLDATTADVDIANSGTTYLQFQMDNDYIYFQFFTEVAPAIGSYTYGVLMDDGGSGTYDYAIASYGQTTSVSLYKWDGSGWDNVNVVLRDADDFNMDTTNKVVQFAVAFYDSFTVITADKFKAVTYDEQNAAFEDGGGDWESTRNPTPALADGDYTAPAAIPEFSTIIMPVGGVIVLFGLIRRRRMNRSRGWQA